MGYTDLHTHSNFCDGAGTPEEMVTAAIERGISRLGILTHSYVEFDKDYSLSPEREAEFIREIARLKKIYSGRIEILCGVEEDYYATSVHPDYDYKIGSVHYFLIDGCYHSLDISRDDFISMTESYFGGDYLAVCEEYYRLVADVIRKTQADIIGHFDLITKFNEGDCLFDSSHPRYIAAYRAAADALIPFGKPFEVNTGAISRGYRTSPYPASDIIEYIKKKGGKLILSSDAHSKHTLAYKFEDFEGLLY